jgi:hypothetical protein
MALLCLIGWNHNWSRQPTDHPTPTGGVQSTLPTGIPWVGFGTDALWVRCISSWHGRCPGLMRIDMDGWLYFARYAHSLKEAWYRGGWCWGWLHLVPASHHILYNSPIRCCAGTSLVLEEHSLNIHGLQRMACWRRWWYLHSSHVLQLQQQMLCKFWKKILVLKVNREQSYQEDTYFYS